MMHWKRRVIVLIGAVSLCAGCGFDGGFLDLSGPLFTAPGPNNSLSGKVTDDSGYLRDEIEYSTGSIGEPLAGVRVELLDGPQSGTATTTDNNGLFSLIGLHPEANKMRLSRPGWESIEVYAGPSTLSIVRDYQMGQAPHVVWGTVAVSGSTPAQRLPGVRVEIVEGSPNVGMTTTTDASGVFRFDDQPTSARLTLRFTLAGYQTAMWGSEVRRNSRIRALLVASR